MVRKLAALAGLTIVAACTPPPPPAPPPPPPPPPKVEQVVIPQRPVPPPGAALDMAIPAIGPDGVRETVNAGLNPLEAVWNFRSGWNVAALNCLEPRYQPILDGYKAFLSANSKRLSKINTELDRQYRTEYSSRNAATRAREAYMTQVYNYFALPPAQAYFCDAALEVSQQLLLAPPSDVDAFALNALPKLEAAFEQFFQDMERYRVNVAAWDAKYGVLYGPAGSTSGAVFTNATYGPPASGTLDLTVAKPVAEDFALPAAEDDSATVFLREPEEQETAPAPALTLPPPGDSGQQPVFSSEPVVQAVPEDGAR